MLTKEQATYYHHLILSGKSVSKLQKENNWRQGYLNQCFRRYKLSYDISRRDYDIDYYFFDKIDTEAKAYFLGLLWSDGTINNKSTQKGQTRISIRLKEEDKYILEAMKDEIAPESKLIKINVKQYTKTDGSIPIQWEFSVSSNHIAKTLALYGITPKKTWDIYRSIPVVDTQLRRHLLRGIFDGNGYTRLLRKNTNTMTCNEIGLCSTSIDSLEEFYAELIKFDHKITGVIKDVTQDRYNTKLYQLTLSTYHSVVATGYYLYHDSSFYLKRKAQRIKLACSRVLHPIGNTSVFYPETILYANPVLNLGRKNPKSVQRV